MNLLRLNVGRDVVLFERSFVKVPGFSPRATWNDLALLIPTTLNVLLNPALAIPDVLFVLVTFRTSTADPTDRL